MGSLWEWAANFSSTNAPLSKMLVFIANLFITYLIVHFASKLLRRLLRRDGNPLPSSTIFVNIMRTFIWIVGISISLKVCYDIDATAFIAALGVGGIALSLGFQDTLTNLVAGLQISLGKIVEPGEIIGVEGVYGKVCDVTWRHTTVVDSFNVVHVIPNSLINTTALLKYPPIRSIDIPFVVDLKESPDDMSELVCKKAQDAASKVAEVASTRVFFNGSIDGGVRGFIRVRVKRDLLDEDEAVSDAVTRAVADLIKPTCSSMPEATTASGASKRS